MSFCTLTLIFLCSLQEVDLVPYSTKKSILVYRSLPVSSKEFELLTALNSLAGAVKTYKLTRVYFLFELMVVVS